MTAGDEGSAEQPNALPAALAAGAGVLFGARLGPGAEVVGAFAGPYLDILIRKSFAEFGADAKERIRLMMGSAREATGCTDDEMEDRLHESDRTRLLNITAMTAAAGTAWSPKVIALGRALAAGLMATDDARVDTEPLILSALADIEFPQASLLELLVRHWPAVNAQSAGIEPLPVGPRAQDTAWATGARVWLSSEIGQARPQLVPVLPSLLGTLHRHGLAAQSPGDGGVDLFGRTRGVMQQRWNSDLARRQRDAGGTAPDLRAIAVYAPPGSWLPTELGEEVINELLAAGADFR